MFLSVCLCVCAVNLPYYKAEQFLASLEQKCHSVTMNIIKDRDERRGLLLWACSVRPMLHSIAFIYTELNTGAFSKLHRFFSVQKCVT